MEWFVKCSFSVFGKNLWQIGDNSFLNIEKNSLLKPSGAGLLFVESFLITSSSNVIYHINREKDKNHMIISTDTEKVFDNTQHPFIIKILNKLGIEGNFLDLQKPTANIMHNDERLKAFLLRSETRKRSLLCQCYSTLYWRF